MKPADEFSEKLELFRNASGRGGQVVSHEGVIDAVIYVNDTLELAWASARTLFGKDAKPEHALAIYDRAIAKLQVDAASEALE